MDVQIVKGGFPVKQLSYYVIYLPVLIAAAVFGLASLFLWLGSRRLLSRSSGGTEWLSAYQASDFGFNRSLLENSCGLLYPAVCAIAALLADFLYSFLCRYYIGANVLNVLKYISTYLRALISAAGAFSVCVLLQNLTGNNVIAVCGALLFGLQRMTQHGTMCLIAAAMFLLLRWYLALEDGKRGRAALLLVAGNLFLGGASYLLPGLYWLLPPFLALYVFVYIRSRSGMARSILLPLLGVFVWAVSFPVIRYCYLFELVGFGAFRIFLSKFTLASLPARVWAMHYIPFTAGRLVYFLADAPLLFGGFFGLLAAFRETTDRKDPLGLFSLIFAGLMVIVSFVMRFNMMTPAMVPAIACLFRRYVKAGKKAPVIAYAAAGAVWYVGLNVAAFCLPACEALVQFVV